MHKSSKTFQFIFFLCLVVFSFFKIALPMEKTSIIISDPPLDDKYMTKDNITQGFCCVFIKPNRTIHTGIDIAAPAGTPVYSIVDGKVYKDNETWDENNYWNSFLIIEHECNNGEKFYVYYGHIFSRLEDKIEVKAGDPIGTIKHDKSGEYDDHLHLSLGFGNHLNRCGWGYCWTCEEAKAEGFVNPLNYLTFKGESLSGKIISCEPESTPIPPPLSPIPIRPRNMKFDVKTKIMEKELTAAAKAGFISYIHQSSWAKTVEFGENNSLWLKNYKRSSNGERIFIQLDLEVRSPAMISEGYLIKRKSLNFEFDESQVKYLQSFRDPQVYEAIKKQLAGQNIPITGELILQEMGFIFKQGNKRDPSPSEALEGLIVGAYLMKALEEQFTIY